MCSGKCIVKVVFKIVVDMVNEGLIFKEEVFWCLDLVVFD